jgi:hypothetical protein
MSISALGKSIHGGEGGGSAGGGGRGGGGGGGDHHAGGRREHASTNSGGMAGNPHQHELAKLRMEAQILKEKVSNPKLNP